MIIHGQGKGGVPVGVCKVVEWTIDSYLGVDQTTYILYTLISCIHSYTLNDQNQNLDIYTYMTKNKLHNNKY